MRNTKGLSPLLATILLIFFAVALGSLVMSLGQQYESHLGDYVINATEICSGATFEVYNVSGMHAACYDEATNKIRYTGVNKGILSIAEIQVWIESHHLQIATDKHEVLPNIPYEGEVNYDAEKQGSVRSLRFIIKVNHDDIPEPYLCSDAPAYIVDDVGIC